MSAIQLVHLYPKEMNIYGDTGNRLILQKRLEWRGYQVKIHFVGVGDKFPANVDLILGGGGQDAGQLAVEEDLHRKADVLHRLAEANVPMLMVCGMYQLFCRRFVTYEKREIKGIGLFAAETVAGSTRMIGNLNVESDYGLLVGYENHSGKTVLDKNAKPLGHVLKGAGNNGEDQHEGCIYKNVFGTYMHGPVLSKNPVLADRILRQVLDRHGKDHPLAPLDDLLEQTAQKVARQRPR